MTMTPVEKIQNEEKDNRSVIILHPEGMFYRAYEHSAYLVCKTIKEFKPTKRFYKIIGQEIVSIGFPKESYSKYIGERSADIDALGTVRIQSGTELDAALFESWKQALPLATARDVKNPIEGDKIQVYRESYALSMKIFSAVVNIQKDYKKVPGEDLMRRSLDLVSAILKANDARDADSRCREISQAQTLAEEIKLYLRVLCDLHQISPGNYMAMSQMAVSVSGQLKAWKSSVETKIP